MKRPLSAAMTIALLSTVLGCSQPLLSRDEGDSVDPVVGAGASAGAAIGATQGAGIGSIWEYAVIGGRVGAGLGLITGAVVGDHFQDVENKRLRLERDIERCEVELQHLSEELEKLKTERSPEPREKSENQNLLPKHWCPADEP